MSLAVQILWRAQLPVRTRIARRRSYESDLFLASESRAEFLSERSQLCYSDVRCEKPSQVNKCFGLPVGAGWLKSFKGCA
jgi:hypothetical protein